MVISNVRRSLIRDPREKRSSTRLRIRQELRYKVLGNLEEIEQVGTGVTLNMSGNGVLFTTDFPLATGARIELAINWGVPLKLVVSGGVIRSEERQAAMSIEKHEFKTRRSDLAMNAAP